MAAIHVSACARPRPAAMPTQELPTTQSTCVSTRSRRRSWRWRLASGVGGVEGMCWIWSHGLAIGIRGGVVGVEVFGQEFVNLLAGLEGQRGVHPVEVVAAG